MWTRAQVKAKGRTSFRGNYWKSLLTALVFSALVGGYGVAASFSGNISSQVSLTGIGPAAGAYVSLLDDYVDVSGFDEYQDAWYSLQNILDTFDISSGTVSATSSGITITDNNGAIVYVDNDGVYIASPDGSVTQIDSDEISPWRIQYFLDLANIGDGTYEAMDNGIEFNGDDGAYLSLGDEGIYALSAEGDVIAIDANGISITQGDFDGPAEGEFDKDSEDQEVAVEDAEGVVVYGYPGMDDGYIGLHVGDEYLYWGPGPSWDYISIGYILGQIPHSVWATIFASILLLVIIFLAFQIVIHAFLINPIEVGVRKFFLTNLNRKAEVKEIATAFDHNYLSGVLTMFLKSLFTFLWTLLFIIPGIVKRYEYRMIPYIIAENPEMKHSEAFALSKQLMHGNKWRTFVLDLSFIGWYLLSLLTFGILSVFYVDPYKAATDAALYENLYYGGNQEAGFATRSPGVSQPTQPAGFAQGGFSSQPTQPAGFAQGGFSSQPTQPAGFAQGGFSSQPTQPLGQSVPAGSPIGHIPDKAAGSTTGASSTQAVESTTSASTAQAVGSTTSASSAQTAGSAANAAPTTPVQAAPPAFPSLNNKAQGDLGTNPDGD